MNISSFYAAARQYRAPDLGSRLESLRALKSLILAQRETLIDRIQFETKKSRSDALMSEIFPSLDWIDVVLKDGPRILQDEFVAGTWALLGKKSKVIYSPLGVVLAITPWNYPFFQGLVPIVSSFISGNALILKPSEWTPLKGLWEDLLKSSGFPQNAVQIAYGDGQWGATLIDGGPDKIFFTGSTITGRKVMERASHQGIPVELELGGKDAALVFEDAHLKRAAAGVVWGALTNCGQSCTSVERVFVHQSVLHEFENEVRGILSSLKSSVDSDGDSDVGTMTLPAQAKKVEEHAQQLRQLSLGSGQGSSGNVLKGPGLAEAFVLPPWREIRGLPALQEETFGPLLPLIPFETEEEGIAAANDSPYGLSASVWTADLKRADRVVRALNVGAVSVNNVMLTEANPRLPFGGVKQSGFGRIKGTMGLRSFCNVKSVLVDGNSGKIEANWYPYTRKKYELFTDMMVGLFSGGLYGFLHFVIKGLRLELLSQKKRDKGIS